MQILNSCSSIQWQCILSSKDCNRHSVGKEKSLALLVGTIQSKLIDVRWEIRDKALEAITLIVNSISGKFNAVVTG